MKKLTIILICLVFSVAGFSQKAKIGHVDYGAIMKEMPGIDTAQTALMEYQKELEQTGQQMVDEFKEKVAELAPKFKKTFVYIFAWSSADDFAYEFEDIPNIQIKAIPLPILEIYKSIYNV